MECHFYFQTTFWFFRNIYGGKGAYGILTQKTCHGFVVKKKLSILFSCIVLFLSISLYKFKALSSKFS